MMRINIDFQKNLIGWTWIKNNGKSVRPKRIIHGYEEHINNNKNQTAINDLT